jgi:hypothetical protein
MKRFYPNGNPRMILGLVLACLVALAPSPALADEEDWSVFNSTTLAYFDQRLSWEEFPVLIP